MIKKYYVFKMNGLILNILSFILLIIMLIITGLIKNSVVITHNEFVLAFVFMIPYLLLHEVLHSLSYVINGADFKNVTYGIHLDKGVLCCLCKQNITKRNILISLISPFIIIGVITYMLGILFNNNILIFLSIINISGCSGDLIMFYDLMRLKDFDYSEYDDPISFGIYTTNDLCNKKLLGLDYVECVDKLKITNLKKFNISKISIIILIIFMLVMIINLMI